MKTRKIAVISIFAAVIIILQIFSSYINISGFPITLTLIPIIVAGAIYGQLIGLLMGLVFGFIVLVMVLTGVDVAGATMFSIHPLITSLTCIIKGAMCGYLGSLTYKITNNKKIALILSAIVTPITNTLILYISLYFFFNSTFKTIIAAFISINFVIELLTNVLLAPGLYGIIHKYTNR